MYGRAHDAELPVNVTRLKPIQKVPFGVVDASALAGAAFVETRASVTMAWAGISGQTLRLHAEKRGGFLAAVEFFVADRDHDGHLLCESPPKTHMPAGSDTFRKPRRHRTERLIESLVVVRQITRLGYKPRLKTL